MTTAGVRPDAHPHPAHAMTSPFVLFWAILTFASIAWYGFLVFYVGLKAGTLDDQDASDA